MRPDELFGDYFFCDIAQFSEEGPFLEVDVNAVSETNLTFTIEEVWVSTEWITNFPATLLVAGNGLSANLLSKAKSQEGLFDFLLLLLQLFEGNL